MKYKNYKELRDAYKDGELSKERHPLIMDNDDCYVYDDEDISLTVEKTLKTIEDILNED